jgi:primosomal protein N' (replication factor Y)
MTELRLLRVALPVPLRRSFDYLAPAAWDESAIQPGSRIRVPFGRGRTMIGLILERPKRTDVEPGRLKVALAAIDNEPLLDRDQMALMLRAAAYYQHPAGDVLFQSLPGRLRAAKPVLEEFEQHFRVCRDAPDPAPGLERAPRQQQALALLAGACDTGLTPSALLQHGISKATLRALVDKNLIESFHREAAPPSPPATLEAIALNPGQAGAVEKIVGTLGRFAVQVLNGVTGSGKTEVYLAVIAEVIRAGRQALVLVPEIGLTPQLVDRVRRRIGSDIAVLHSGLPDMERARSWLAARDGRARVVLGTRSAVWTPLSAAGLIVVDEEHDLSYKQQEGFRYSARDMAVARGKSAGIPVILGSATPSLETLRNVQEGRYGELRLTQRAGGAPPPAVGFIDLRGARMHGAVSARLLDAVRAEVTQGNQVLLFLNRRGYSPTLQCHKCGTVAECPRCNMPYTWHKHRNRLLCHHCGSEQPARLQCASCPDSELLQIGHGTERLAETLGQQLPEARILRIDRDSTRAQGAMGRMVAQIHAREADILIGTQMLAKGHHFPALTLVGIIDADRGLFSADFRAAERMAQLFVQVCGRAGRGDRRGQVLIQTHHPDHPFLRSLVEHGYERFAQLALAERDAAKLPPYSHIAVLRAEHYQAGPAQRFLEHARALLEDGDARLQIFGPVPAVLERRGGRFRFQLLIQASQRARLGSALSPWLQQLEAEPLAGKVRWSLDVDPQDMI